MRSAVDPARSRTARRPSGASGSARKPRAGRGAGRAAWLLCGGLLPALSALAQGPALVPAALSSIAPSGVTRGQEVLFTLGGVSIGGATRAVFSDPGITGDIEAGSGPNQVRVRAKIGTEVRPGIHSVSLRTPLGTTGGVPFAVGAWPELREKEPNDRFDAAPLVELPATMVGAMDRTGDADLYRFRAEAGEELVFEVIAAPIRSTVASVLSILDESGRVVAESELREGRQDAVLGHRFEQAGTYAVRIRDFESRGGGDVFYRLNAGRFVHVESVFPLGVPASGGKVTLRGWNLGGARSVEVGGGEGTGLPHPAAAPAAAVASTEAGPLHSAVRVALGEFPESEEASASNDSPASAERMPAVPGTVNGRIEKPGDADCYAFAARKGQELVIEVQARRFGSPLDSVIEVTDTLGRRIERATLRCLAQTVLTLSDRDSASAGLRLLAWNDLAIHDFVYIRGELVQVAGLPQGPDADVLFRNFRGQRVGFLDTTPTAHAVETPIYKVAIYPPGRTFPPNGMPVFRLHYRNDDGGPLYGKDSRLAFTAPADGTYVVRIADVRGEGSDRHAYRLTLREPRPDFRLSLSPEHPNVPQGASVPLDVSVERLDGFDGEIEVSLEGLPEGFTATSTTIEAGETSAVLLLTAGPASAERRGELQPARPLRLVGRARTASGEIVRTAEPAGGRPVITVLPKPDLQVATDLTKITIAPGGEVWLEARIERQNGFAGRVPIEMRNLPFGVRVPDVGLNGVLITEAETSRRFPIYCEPFVKPMKRLVYCTVRTETASPAPTAVAAAPILLEILPDPASRRAGGSRPRGRP